MKGLVILGVLVVAIAGIFWWQMAVVNEEPGQPIALVFGNTRDDTIEMHVVISVVMPRAETDRHCSAYTGADGGVWRRWIAPHLLVTNAAGEPVEFDFQPRSSLVSDLKAGGVPEGYAVARLKRGADYTFDFVPCISAPARYRCQFAAPREPQEFRRVTFMPVKD